MMMCGLPTRLEWLLISATLIACLVSGTAAAQSRTAPIRIEADQGEVSQRTGKSVYTGNVAVTQAAMELRGDKLTVHRKDNDRIRAVLVGDPARLERTPDQGEKVTGHARRMTYRSAEDMVELTGDAFIKRGDNTLRGATIRHNLTTARTRAERGDGERVHITIQPDSENASDNGGNSEARSQDGSAADDR